MTRLEIAESAVTLLHFCPVCPALGILNKLNVNIYNDFIYIYIYFIRSWWQCPVFHSGFKMSHCPTHATPIKSTVFQTRGPNGPDWVRLDQNAPD